jgi:hypothetical protein
VNSVDDEDEEPKERIPETQKKQKLGKMKISAK